MEIISALNQKIALVTQTLNPEEKQLERPHLIACKIKSSELSKSIRNDAQEVIIAHI